MVRPGSVVDIVASICGHVSPTSSPSEITVRVPAIAEHVHIVRGVVASVAARAGASVDDVADLRLIVDEAAARLLSGTTGATSLTVSLAAHDASLEVTASVDGTPVEHSGSALGWRILSTLADEVEELDEGSVTTIRVRRSLGATV
jgi:serine/threonine-protein kinase RsbW